jgi:hypothetical protein
MNEASEKLALEIATGCAGLADKLREMAAYEQKLNRPFLLYVYPLTSQEIRYTSRHGLVRTTDGGDTLRFRLTSYGRDVVDSLSLLLEKP